ncbi:hypothetical protein [Deinococcus sedimenti]|uniref:Uncharacterized protein n=1 Tax=Deinococcus sedimenti TaxID=1867090 RepID=A0ABQ2S452_9DEIO|nr:hypothetical protein [Deinococcus sedimenti]GGR92812.1 hypothetical protein GCM10008960_19780 [Deinococcus sedimenti]
MKRLLTIAGLGLALLIACSPQAQAVTGLLGGPLMKPVTTVEGPVPMPVSVEQASFCRVYQCVGSTSLGTTTTGSIDWYAVARNQNATTVLQQSAKGAFYPQLTVQFEKNTVLFVNLALDTKVRSPMPAATLNLLGNFTRLVLGAPVSAQKLSGCYRSLRTEATCVVGRGQVRVGGVQRWYVAAFRTVDDGEGYSVVNYAIGLED